jgi:hypothetical protein
MFRRSRLRRRLAAPLAPLQNIQNLFYMRFFAIRFLPVTFCLPEKTYISLCSEALAAGGNGARVEKAKKLAFDAGSCFFENPRIYRDAKEIFQI